MDTDNVDNDSDLLEFLCDSDDSDIDILFDNTDKQNKKTKQKWNHERLDWRYHVTKLCHENKFEREYRMSTKSWDVLFEILKNDLMRNSKKVRSVQSIDVSIIMGIGMRWLAGEKNGIIKKLI